MIKKYYIFALGILLTLAVSAQSPIAKGQSQLNFGVGFSSWGVPLYFGFDHGVHKDITLGAEFSFRNFNDNYRNQRYRRSIIGFSGNANYHFNTILNIPSNWDFYAGLNLGFYHWTNRERDRDLYRDGYNSGVGLGAQVGGRYYFNKNVGVNLEFGGGNAFSGGKFGLSILL
jgi:hypothetical protein